MDRTKKDRRPIKEPLADQFPDNYGKGGKIVTPESQQFIEAILTATNHLIQKRERQSDTWLWGKHLLLTNYAQAEHASLIIIQID